MLKIQEVKKRKIKAGTFGKCGKMVIKPFSVAKEYRWKCIQYILENIMLVENGDFNCWEWTGRIHNRYACFQKGIGRSNSTRWAHRVSYAVFVGKIKAGMHIDHKCRNPICVNPLHLQQKTPYENYEAIQRRKRRDEREALERAGQLNLW